MYLIMIKFKSQNQIDILTYGSFPTRVEDTEIPSHVQSVVDTVGHAGYQDNKVSISIFKSGSWNYKKFEESLRG